MPTYASYNIPFLGGGPSIAEQILEGLHQGFQEKAQTKQLGIEQQQADTSSQRATSDVALQSAQTDQIRQDIARKKMLSDALFTPKPDHHAGLNPPNDLPSATPGTPAPPMRTDWRPAPAAPCNTRP